jgi:trans-aconitate methyltransferase
VVSIGWASTAPDWLAAGMPSSELTAPSSEWTPTGLPEPAADPVDETLIDLAAEMPPGKALDLGCGSGQNAVWLAQRGWVVTAVDSSPDAIEETRAAAARAGVSVVGIVADATAWRPTSRYDLVLSTFALPPRGMGRSRLLEMAAASVAPGGAIIVRELDAALAREGRMPEKYLVSREELERHLDGFRIQRSHTRLTRRPHGYEEIVVPVATVVGLRRTDLRSLY